MIAFPLPMIVAPADWPRAGKGRARALGPLSSRWGVNLAAATLPRREGPLRREMPTEPPGPKLLFSNGGSPAVGPSGWELCSPLAL